MFRTSLAVLGLSALLAGSALAADANGRAYVVGAMGLTPCSDVTTKVNAGDEKFAYEMTLWVGGYVTGANRATENTFNFIGNTTPEAFLTSLLSHCTSNPTHDLEGAVMTVLTGLYPARQTEMPAQ